MSSPVALADASAPTWRHGPDGEIGVGDIDWQRLRSFMLVMWLPAFILMFFAFSCAFFILCGAVPVAVRFARLHGTPSLVDATTAHWGMIFASGALAMLVAYELDPGTGFWSVVYTLLVLAFLYATLVHFDAKKLIAWEPAKAASGPQVPVSIADLKAMREEIEWGRVSLATLPVFDDKKSELLKAWEERDPPRIAHLLQEGNVQTQESWTRVNAMFNRAQTYVDRARNKLSGMLSEAEQRLKPFNINYDAIAVEPSKQGHLEMSAAIPKNLTAKRINQQNTAFIQGGARSVAQGAFGQLPPLAAVAAVGIAVAAHFIYKSRTLRKLKDVEGQLVINAKAVRGDCDMVNSVFTTRLLPQFDAMMDVTSRLEQGLANLQENSINTDDKTQRDTALQMAFALVQGRKLVSTAGGN